MKGEMIRMHQFSRIRFLFPAALVAVLLPNPTIKWKKKGKRSKDLTSDALSSFLWKARLFDLLFFTCHSYCWLVFLLLSHYVENSHLVVVVCLVTFSLADPIFYDFFPSAIQSVDRFPCFVSRPSAWSTSAINPPSNRSSDNSVSWKTTSWIVVQPTWQSAIEKRWHTET